MVDVSGGHKVQKLGQMFIFQFVENKVFNIIEYIRVITSVDFNCFYDLRIQVGWQIKILF
ncbi:Uncharacterised protein [Chlamydia trachomatis]|nr:Uncharacterised protein [Chlamydia trachomatis]